MYDEFLNQTDTNKNISNKNLNFLNKFFRCNRKETSVSTTNTSNQKNPRAELVNTFLSSASSNDDIIYVNTDMNELNQTDYANSIRLRRYQQLHQQQQCN